MNREEQPLSEQQLDFLGEMMNIGAGHAVTALSQLLQCSVDLKIPVVHSLTIPEATSILGERAFPVSCVRLGMVGDVRGDLFFIVPAKQKPDLVALAEQANLGPNTLKEHSRQSAKLDLSVLAEVGNIIAGVYLRAIYDFCRLNMYHTVPIPAVDMIQPRLEELLATLSQEVRRIILIENEFVVREKCTMAFFLLILSEKSLETLVGSIEQARIT